jgi:hypothetical protein
VPELAGWRDRAENPLICQAEISRTEDSIEIVVD